MLTISSVLLAAAGALLCWPAARARERMHRMWHGDAACAAKASRRPTWFGVAPLVALASLALGAGAAGIAGACAAPVLVHLGDRYWRSRRRARIRRNRVQEFAAGLRLFVAELRVGSHQADAAEGAAEDAPAGVAPLFRNLAATTRLGGDATAVLAGEAATDAELAGPLGRMARAWSLAERHGVPLADLLDAVRRDVEHGMAFVRDVEAKMAGPRATAAVLAALPVLGVLLGAAVGAAPLHVFRDGWAGQVLLLVGVGLLCAGAVWTGRLTRTAVGP